MGVRICLAALATGLLLSGAAHANDYVVVNSTDPAIAKGAAFDRGAVVPVAPGSALTVISSTGRLSTHRAAGGFVSLPQLAAAPQPGVAEKIASILRRPAPRRVTGAMRGPAGCAPVGDLTTLDLILAAETAGCTLNAKRALDAYLAREAIHDSSAADVANAQPGADPQP